jgi:DNA-binding HxlR family transcriptional regulator
MKDAGAIPVPTSSGQDDCCGSCAPSPHLLARFRRSLRALSGKWKVEILTALIDEPRRFGELRRAVPGVTQHVLTEQLRELAADGLVRRTAYGERALRVEYELTSAGYGLLPVFRALRDWSETFTDAIGVPA